MPTESLTPQYRTPLVHLWLGSDAHLVHYPVKGGKLVKVKDWFQGNRPTILKHLAADASKS